MELIAAAALLWRHRVLVAIGLVIALGLGYKASNGPTTSFGTASTRIVLDTDTSQVLDVDPPGADTLAGRAAVLADLSQSNDLKAKIASGAGVELKDLIIQAPYLSTPPDSTALPVKALEAAAAIPSPYVLSVHSLPYLPIVVIDASGPRAVDAARLTGVAAKVLESEAIAYRGDPDVQPFVINRLSPVKSETVINGPRRAMAGVIALVVFVMWCFGVMLLASVVRATRLSHSGSSAPMTGSV